MFCYQVLRDEEGKKLGLKPSDKSSSSKDNDVKMLDAEVYFIYLMFDIIKVILGSSRDFLNSCLSLGV